MTPLSILIPTTPDRKPYLDALLDWMGFSSLLRDTEVLIDDHPFQPTGLKRNQLVKKATRKYCVHIDDDDLPAPGFIEEITFWARHYDVDAFGYFVQCYEDGVKKETGKYSRTHSNYQSATDPNGKPMYLRPISHICPVRTAIAQAVAFPNDTKCEDVGWTLDVRPLIKTEKFIPRYMYHYFMRNDKTIVPTKRDLYDRESMIWMGDRAPTWEDTTDYMREMRRIQDREWEAANV